MKNLVTVAAVGVLAFCIYKYKTDSAKEAPKTELEEKLGPKKMKPGPKQAVAISTMIEPWYVNLFSELNLKKPEDLVPPLTIGKDQLVKSKPLVEPQKHQVYDLGITVLSRMIDTAEERTKALEAMVQAAANDKSSLD